MLARLAHGAVSPVLAAVLAASCAGVIVASAAPSEAVHGQGLGGVAAGHGNGRPNGHQEVGAVAQLGVAAHGVMARIAGAVTELEAGDNGQAPSAAVLGVAESISPSALAPGHVSRLFDLNATAAPVGAPETGGVPAAARARTPVATAPGVTVSGSAGASQTTGSLPAAASRAEPTLPSVVIAPPSTLPSPPTFVPSPSGGVSILLIVGLIASAAALAALLGIRLAHRPG